MKKKKPKFLIVDDNPKNIQVLAGFLSAAGYDLGYSTSGAEALEWVAVEDFDLVLLDIMMPGMDGFEVCERIKRDPKNRDLPIIFLTAKTDIESISRAFDIGGVDYISKPFNSQELLARVATHVKLKQSKDSLNEMNLRLENMNLRLEDTVAARTQQLNESLKELASANTELKSLERCKSEFMMLLSHEIRTPLNGILGGLSFLKEAELPEETLIYIEILDGSTKRLEAFSMKTLDISQLRTRGKDALTTEAIYFANVLENQLESLQPLIDVKKIKIDIRGRNDIHLNADNHYINKAVKMLLDNAVYFSPENGNIMIDVEEHKGLVGCTISDQGEGFPEPMLSRPIKSFYGELRNVDQKTGLGLYFANQIAELHNGNISFGNKKEGGAFVRLELPRN